MGITIGVLPAGKFNAITDVPGVKDDQAIIEFPKENIPPDMKLDVGMQLQLTNENGQPFQVTVSEIKDDVVVLDANHSLAGKELVFDIELMEIVSWS